MSLADFNKRLDAIARHSDPPACWVSDRWLDAAVEAGLITDTDANEVRRIAPKVGQHLYVLDSTQMLKRAEELNKAREQLDDIKNILD